MADEPLRCAVVIRLYRAEKCFGPGVVQLLEIVDRGHRELPLRGDYIGKNVPTAQSEQIKVRIPPYDDMICVDLYEKT